MTSNEYNQTKDQEDNLTNSLIKNISQSKLLTDPFEHKFIKNVFPKNFYEKFLNNIPDISLYTRITETGSVSSKYSPERYIFNFEKTVMKKLNKTQNIFFKELLTSTLSKALFSSVTSQFSEILKERIQNFSHFEKNENPKIL